MQRRSPPSFKEQREAERAKAKRTALKALRKARLAAAETGIAFSEWEGEFLESVGTRVQTYGRAFADPEKGSPSSSLSILQTVKLKQITAKAKGKTRKPMGRSARSD
jgi:hypothetical protein